ncbi:hypothetical protein INT45_007857 [Circinella minor]|uniref:Uncharacterized protein n=1 Tax=Circinella minor TaxID=1195481 RepID=A0A8H7VKQ0_9FUNG|nr:hypothetical protein INT45_007857 [Circinella minor]
MIKQDLSGPSSSTTLDKKNCLLWSPGTASSSSTSSPGLKTRITITDKAILKKRFEKFKNNNKKDFWYLQATIQQAEEEEDVDLLSVEEKVMKFALECEYYHPSQSLVLDLGDKNWVSIFTEEELDELRDAGRDLPLGVPEELNECFHGLGRLKPSGGAFKYSRKIGIDHPKNELLKVWFCNEVEQVSSLFLKTGSLDIGDLMESDPLYVGFGLFSSIFRGSDIVAKNCGDIELGCTEIGPGKDQTKEIRDSMLKIHIVLRDMLLSTTFVPSLLHKSHVIGYGVFGSFYPCIIHSCGSVSLLDADIPEGFVTRIRRTEPLTFPNNNGDFLDVYDFDFTVQNLKPLCYKNWAVKLQPPHALVEP